MLKRSSSLLRFFARSIASNGMLGLKRLMHAFAYPFPFVFLFPSPYSRSTIRILARRIEEQNKYLPLNCSFRLYFEQKWIETSLRGKIISNSREVFRREGSLFRFFKRSFFRYLHGLSTDTFPSFTLTMQPSYLRPKDVVFLAVLQALRFVPLDEMEGFGAEFRVASIVGLVARVGETGGYRHVSIGQFVLQCFRA